MQNRHRALSQPNGVVIVGALAPPFLRSVVGPRLDIIFASTTRLALAFWPWVMKVKGMIEQMFISLWKSFSHSDSRE
jgi:hypothetical protein